MGKANQFSSHQSDPLAAAAGLAVMGIIEEERLIEHAVEMGQTMLTQLQALAEKHPYLINVRGRGLMIGFDVLPPNPPNSQPSVPSPQPSILRDIGRSIEDYCRERGVHFQSIQRNRFRILPPLTIQQDEIDRFITVLDDALVALKAGEARPRPAVNPHTQAYQAKQNRGLRKMVEWAWTHSPKAWVEKLRKKT